MEGLIEKLKELMKYYVSCIYNFGYFSFLIMNCTHNINSLHSSKTSLECVKYNEWLWLLITRAGRKHSWARNAQDKCFWKMRHEANWMSLECAIMVPEGLWYYNWITSTPHSCPTPMTKHTFNFPKQFQSVSGEILEFFLLYHNDTCVFI